MSVHSAQFVLDLVTIRCRDGGTAVPPGLLALPAARLASDVGRRRVLLALTSSGFFPQLKSDVYPLMDPASHQHRSLISICLGQRVPVTAFLNTTRLMAAGVGTVRT